MEFKLDDGVPVPSILHGNQKYPFGMMEVGQSFAVTSTQFTYVRNAAHSFARRSEFTKEFIVRKHEDAYRCWRVK